MSNNSLSKRGQKASETPLRSDMEIYFEALDNKFDSRENPKGTFPMNVAENILCWDMLKKKIEAVSQLPLPDWVAGYGNPIGNDEFRQIVAEHLSTFLFHTAVDKETLAFSSGLTSVIDLTAFLLADHGDFALIPAPSYPVYTSDLGVKAGVRRHDIQTNKNLSELKNGIPLEIEQLEQAKLQLQKSGNKCSLLILTTPDNPTGSIYTEDQLKQISDWCISNRVHLIVNEIYGLTLIDIEHQKIKEDYIDRVQFSSFGQIMKTRKSPYLHLWYSFSKDLGLSGFRVGMVHSYNEDFIKGYSNANMTHSVSNYTQWILMNVLKDQSFMKEYLTRFQAALTKSYVMIVDLLKSHGIRYAPSYGSLFIWLNLETYLKDKSGESENQLWMDIYERTGILLTPTDGFGHDEYGLYRMVISFQSHDDLEVALERLDKYFSSGS